MIDSFRTILGSRFIGGIKKYINQHLTDYHSSSFGSVSFESKTFALSANGLDITGSDTGITLSAGIPLTLDTLVGGTGYTAGVKETTGGTGTGLTVLVTVAGGIIQTASISNAGSGYLAGDTVNITGGNSDATINVATISSPIITIPTTKRLKLGFFHITGGGRYSIGKSDGTLHNSIGVGSTNTLGSQTKCIDIASGGNGWTGLISAINATTFDITFTQVGSGLAITGQMQLIEG